MSATVGELLATNPHAARVCQRHGVDLRSHLTETFVQVCAAKKLDFDAILREVSVESNQIFASHQWKQANMREFIQHLVDRWHTPLRDAVRQVLQLVRRVVEDLPEGHADLSRLERAVQALHDDLLPHLEQEESVLFPWILLGRGPSASPSIAVMRMEHQDLYRLLDEIRWLMKGCAARYNVDRVHVSLWRALTHLDIDLVEHIALEEHVLYPRALAGDR